MAWPFEKAAVMGPSEAARFKANRREYFGGISGFEAGSLGFHYLLNTGERNFFPGTEF